MAATAEGQKSSVLDEISSKAPPGTILPPRNVREIIEKTAGYVARNGKAFEDRIKDQQKGNAKMSFILPEDEYNPYYRWRYEEIKGGKVTHISAGRKEGEVSFQGREERKGPPKPEEFAFHYRMPDTGAADFEVISLTALYGAVALNSGNDWVKSLGQREVRNPQFTFLQAQHSKRRLFDDLMTHHRSLTDDDSMDNGPVQQKRIAELEANVNNRYRILEKAKIRAEWERHDEAQKLAKKEQEKKDDIEFHQIDWHDFVVVETVLFDDDDAGVLPTPPTKNDLQSASLEQKAAMAIQPDRRLEEAMPGFDDHEQFYGQPAQMPAAQQSPAPPVQMPNPPTPQNLPSRPTPPQTQTAYQMPQQNGDSSRISSLQADRERAHAAQEAARAQLPMKIRSDYTPSAQQAKKSAQNTSICPNCKQAIPNDEIQRHIQIEMLDPQWREQSRKNQQRSLTTNLNTGEVANNLKRLASQRTDVFDPITGQAVDPDEQERRKRAEIQAYDGVSTMPNQQALSGMAPPPPGTSAGAPGAPGAPGQEGKGPVDVQEQIRALHQKYKT